VGSGSDSNDTTSDRYAQRVPRQVLLFHRRLDEYGGAEEELVETLQFLSMSSTIKICASTRPRRLFQHFFRNSNRMFDISTFTKEDVRLYIWKGLQENQNFLELQKHGPGCEDIVNTVSDLAQGVWLWVYLVRRDLIHAVNRDEGVTMLQKIVRQFPADLEEYFKRMIEAVRPQYREEMSRIFLITVDELQPLPLFAFSLLENLCSDRTFAINYQMRPISEDEITPHYPRWTSWINNRCSDLLVIDEQPHPTFLSHSVDFLHRSVRDFLRDNYYPNLLLNMRTEFCSTMMLAGMCLVLLKSMSIKDFRNDHSLYVVSFSLMDDILYYVHETEKRDEDYTKIIVATLDEVDRVSGQHARDFRNHSPSNDLRPVTCLDVYINDDSHSFLGLTIQARLVKYVGAKLIECPSSVRKRGRPLLDYALRPKRTISITMPYHSQREDPSMDIEMIRLLLNNGADPNRGVEWMTKLYGRCSSSRATSPIMMVVLITTPMVVS
jgi:hypothetical protein